MRQNRFSGAARLAEGQPQRVARIELKVRPMTVHVPGPALVCELCEMVVDQLVLFHRAFDEPLYICSDCRAALDDVIRF